MKTVLVTGAGGFIGGHLVKNLIKKKYKVVCADIKPIKRWFQVFKKTKKYSVDLKNYSSCLKITKNTDYVFNLACNMGGMGFIENNKADCMTSVLINTNLLRASKKRNIKKYLFSSSACVYNADKQSLLFNPALKEKDAYPAQPEDGYGWEKLFSERMCRHFQEDYGLQVRIIRFHNVYGPYGTYDGGREKAPAAICRKIVEAKLNKKKKIEVWGDGKQTRSFMFIDDCIEGILKIFFSKFSNPINLGSSERVSINQMIKIIEKIALIKLEKKYLLNKPKGVRGRSSDNKLIKKILNWEPSIKLNVGLEKTYNWIYSEISRNSNNKKFIN